MSNFQYRRTKIVARFLGKIVGYAFGVSLIVLLFVAMGYQEQTEGPRKIAQVLCEREGGILAEDDEARQRFVCFDASQKIHKVYDRNFIIKIFQTKR